MKYLLQKYADGAYGYKGFDNLNFEHGKVILEQSEDQDREEFIKVNNISFEKNEYGSDIDKDIRIIVDFEREYFSDLCKFAKQKYAIEKISQYEGDYKDEVKCSIAACNLSYADKVINDYESYDFHIISNALEGCSLEVFKEKYREVYENNKNNYILYAIIRRAYLEDLPELLIKFSEKDYSNLFDFEAAISAYLLWKMKLNYLLVCNNKIVCTSRFSYIGDRDILIKDDVINFIADLIKNKEYIWACICSNRLVKYELHDEKIQLFVGHEEYIPDKNILKEVISLKNKKPKENIRQRFLKRYKEDKEYRNKFNDFLTGMKPHIEFGESWHFSVEPYYKEDEFSEIMESFDFEVKYCFDAEKFIEFCNKIGFNNREFHSRSIEKIINEMKDYVDMEAVGDIEKYDSAVELFNAMCANFLY